MRTQRTRGPALLAAIASVAVLTACGGSSSAALIGRSEGSAASSPPVPSFPPVASSAPATSSPPAVDGAFSGQVDIGGGRHLFAVCQGTKKPTIFLEAGDESDIDQWSAVMPQLVDHARTCAYERLGVRRSDPATGCRGPDDLRQDTEALLKRLGEQGPYLLVGHSGGGFLMADFAYAHPRDVLGMVFVETPKAVDPKRESSDVLAEIDCHSADNEEHRNYVAVEGYAWQHRHKIGDVPLTVISNQYTAPYADYEDATNVADQRGWFVLSPQARQVVVTSGHEVEENEPDLVANEILRVLSSVRS